MCSKGHGALERVLSHGLGPVVRSLGIPSLTPQLIIHSFFEEVNRICAPDYIPIEADVLRARTKTTGIYETRFTMGQLSIQ